MTGTLWIGTRKGLFALRGDAQRRQWKLIGPQFLGHVFHHVVQDPREPKVVLAAVKTGHLGPTVFRSSDRYPGMRFRMIDEQDRIRPHIRLYVDTRPVLELDQPIEAGATLHLICALSGG